MERQGNWYNYSNDEVVRILKTDQVEGLNQAEAKKRLDHIGKNVLAEKANMSPILLFLMQFKDFMVLILLGA
ncbi:MAG TPA: hypothetical protein DDY49_00500, partial [Paenibacillaceae bacterium]|nr:hypothetical protein [Paenibacillaceae bacterium]